MAEQSANNGDIMFDTTYVSRAYFDLFLECRAGSCEFRVDQKSCFDWINEIDNSISAGVDSDGNPVYASFSRRLETQGIYEDDYRFLLKATADNTRVEIRVTSP